MKRVLLIIVKIMLIGFVKAGCDGGTITVDQGNIGSINVKQQCIDQIAMDLGCSYSYDNDYEWTAMSLVIGDAYFGLTTLTQFMPSDLTSFNKNSLTNWLYSNNAPASNFGSNSVLSVSELAAEADVWHLLIVVKLNNIFNSGGDLYVQKHEINNVSGINVLSSYCSGVPLLFQDLITTVPSWHSNPTIIFANGDNFQNNEVILTQSPNDIYSFEYRAEVNGYTSRRPVITEVHEQRDAYFTDVVQSGGPITTQNSATLMNSYTTNTGGIEEYLGSGLVSNGTDWYFDPSVAGPGQHAMFVRSNNQGCYSEWRDTIFDITPIVVGFSQPQFNIPATFGGDQGGFAGKNVTGTPTLAGLFHMGCSDRDYTFSTTNLQTGLQIEYQVVWHNNIIDQGTSAGPFTITMPSWNDVLLNQEQSIYSIDSIALNNNLPYNLALVYGTGQDITGDGQVDGDDVLFTEYLGDVLQVQARYFNVQNDYSDWTTMYVGVVPNPEVDKTNPLCFDVDPVMSPVTDVPLYMDTMNQDAYRSVLWDIDMDGTFELDGSIDNFLLLLPSQNKAETMRQFIVDSTLVRGWNEFTNSYFDLWIPEISEVCFSNVDTTYVVRNPDYSLSFSAVDTIQYGTPVLGVITGQWFDDTLDLLTWNWTDGSPEYYGDSVWHYHNDLGFYSLEVAIEDTYGCRVEQNFIDYWLVPGTLNLDEELEISLKAYPVPVVDFLTIETDKKIERIEVYDLFGRVVHRESNKVLDLSALKSGGYLVYIEVEGSTVVRKIVKQ